MTVPNNALSEAKDGEPAVTTGFLGRGKLIPSNTPGSSDNLILGDHHSVGKEAGYSKEKECM